MRELGIALSHLTFVLLGGMALLVVGISLQAESPLIESLVKLDNPQCWSS
jgi:hypothetical protein